MRWAVKWFGFVEFLRPPETRRPSGPPPQTILHLALCRKRCFNGPTLWLSFRRFSSPLYSRSPGCVSSQKGCVSLQASTCIESAPGVGEWNDGRWRRGSVLCSRAVAPLLTSEYCRNFGLRSDGAASHSDKWREWHGDYTLLYSVKWMFYRAWLAWHYKPTRAPILI